MMLYPVFFFCLASLATAQPSIGLDAACQTLTTLLQVSGDMAQPQYGVKSLCESLNADVHAFFHDDPAAARDCYLNMMNDYQLKLLKAKQEVVLSGKCGEPYWSAPATCSQACIADMAEAAAALLVPSPKCESTAKLMKCNLEQMCDLITTTSTTTTTTTNTGTTTPTICNRDTGGSCVIFPCHPWRGPTACARTSAFQSQCLCLAGYCAAKNGTCVKSEYEESCKKDTKSTCQWMPCRPYLQAECINGECLCGHGDCVGGEFGLCERGLEPIPNPIVHDECPATSTQTQKSPPDFNYVASVLPDVGDPVFMCVVFSMFLMLVVTAWTWRTISQNTRAIYSQPLLE